MIVVAAGDLLGRATGGRHNEDVSVAGLKNALAVGRPAQLRNHDGRVGPLRAGRFFGQMNGPVRFRKHSRRIANPPAVGRPFDPGRRLFQIRDLRVLAAVQPAHVNLVLAAAVGQVSQTRSIGREPRVGITEGASGERPVVLAVARNDPQVAEPRVGHFIGPTQHVNDALAVLGDLGVADRAHFPNRFSIEAGLRCKRCGGREQNQAQVPRVESHV